MDHRYYSPSFFPLKSPSFAVNSNVSPLMMLIIHSDDSNCDLLLLKIIYSTSLSYRRDLNSMYCYPYLFSPFPRGSTSSLRVCGKVVALNKRNEHGAASGDDSNIK